MEFPSKEKQINGTFYQITHLPMRQWFELEALVLKKFGPSISQFLSSWSLGADNETLAVGTALYQLAQDADADTHETLIKELSKCTTVKEQNLGEVYEAWWPTHMKDLAEFLVFALEVQFGDFFDGLKSVVKNRKKEVSKSE